MTPFKDQQTFLNYFQNELWVTRTEKFLTKLEKVVPWTSISEKIKQNRTITEWWVGRPRTEVLRLIKILFLQWLYWLSDPEVEDQIREMIKRDRMDDQVLKMLAQAWIKDLDSYKEAYTRKSPDFQTIAR